MFFIYRVVESRCTLRQHSNVFYVCLSFVITFKGATKLYFMNYSRVVIIFYRTGLQKSGFPTYSFGKTRFSSFYVLVFCVSVSLCFCFCIFVVFQYALNSIS